MAHVIKLAPGMQIIYGACGTLRRKVIIPLLGFGVWGLSHAVTETMREPAAGWTWSSVSGYTSKQQPGVRQRKSFESTCEYISSLILLKSERHAATSHISNIIIASQIFSAQPAGVQR